MYEVGSETYENGAAVLVDLFPFSDILEWN